MSAFSSTATTSINRSKHHKATKKNTNNESKHTTTTSDDAETENDDDSSITIETKPLQTNASSFLTERLQQQSMSTSPIYWIELFSYLPFLGLIIMILFIVFELVGDSPVFISSSGWMITIAVFAGYFIILLIASISVMIGSALQAKKKAHLYKCIQLHFVGSLSLWVLFVFAYYTSTLNSVTNALQIQTNRNLISAVFLIDITFCCSLLFEVIFYVKMYP